MRVLFDAYWWVDGPPSGASILRDIVQEWSESYPEDEIILAIPRRKCDGANFEIASNVKVVRTHLRFHPLINFVELPIMTRLLFRVDAVIAQNFTPFARNSVTFVHDVLFQTNPEYFKRDELLYMSLISRTFRRKAKYMTSSLTERERIMTKNPKLSNVFVTGLAVSKSLARVTAVEPNLGLTVNNFILTVGRINTRKNLTSTIEAFLRSTARAEGMRLVIVGEKSGRADALSQQALQGIHDGSIIMTGYLRDAQLRWLYENCALFCFLSLAEGYGLPPSEAAMFGAKIVVSDIDVHRETVTPDACFVDPLNIDEVRDQIDKICRSDDTPSTYPPSKSEDASTGWRGIVDKIRALASNNASQELGV